MHSHTLKSIMYLLQWELRKSSMFFWCGGSTALAPVLKITHPHRRSCDLVRLSSDQCLLGIIDLFLDLKFCNGKRW